MVKYQPELKALIVGQYLNANLSISELAKNMMFLSAKFFLGSKTIN